MLTVGILIDVDDETHYRVSLHEQTAMGFAEVSQAVIGRPLQPLPGDGSDASDLCAQLINALSGMNPNVDIIRRLGKHLWSLAFDGAIGTAWAERHPSRTILDIRPSELQRLPWEALQLNGKIVFTASDLLFVRAPMSLAPVPLVNPPLRVLAVVGEREHTEDNRLRWNEELRALEVLGARQPHRFHVEVLEAPNKAQLRAACEALQPHVLHVIAHGMVIGHSPGVRIGQPPNSFMLDPDTVENELAYKFPLVILNACHTGESAAFEGTIGLGEAFRANGSAATLCMQGAIHDAAAADFSRAFYDKLVSGVALDTACVAGRQAIAETHSGADRWLPQLVLHAAPGPLLSAPPQLTSPDPVGAIDRSSERRQLLFALDPGAKTPPRRAAIIHGDPRVGKTWVARSAGDLLRSAGAVLRYVDLQGSSNLGWLDVLRAIRDPASGGTPTAQLPPELFATFNASVNAVAAGKPPPENLKGHLVDEFGAIGPVSERTLDHVGVLFQVFLEALTASAGTKPLILILDHLEKVDPDELTMFIVPQLLRPIAQGEVPDVSVILVAGAAALDPLRGLPALLVPVHLPTANEYLRLAAVYGDIWFGMNTFSSDEYKKNKIADYVSYVEAVKPKEPWSLTRLQALFTAAVGQVD
ncbi:MULTISPECIES: CHAT domain-containing protein [Pseudarthrobacter]|uniref:CHAT domain-containing protein n=1 Tax=Pseudarthrobacter TaxID=1742993 RepID=UPI0013DD2D62|nr:MULTISPECIES: CHAT domain-containing protein [Pseudarthrobacter]MDQ0000102.1 hypothetical protein [Pseudarthrobacter sulfonivorans]